MQFFFLMFWTQYRAFFLPPKYLGSKAELSWAGQAFSVYWNFIYFPGSTTLNFIVFIMPFLSSQKIYCSFIFHKNCISLFLAQFHSIWIFFCSVSLVDYSSRRVELLVYGSLNSCSFLTIVSAQDVFFFKDFIFSFIWERGRERENRK